LEDDAGGGKRWSSTNLGISLSSSVEGLTIPRCEAAMEVEKGIWCGKSSREKKASSNKSARSKWEQWQQSEL
jgi:hypothetical protein